jgi:hypothetical protein
MTWYDQAATEINSIIIGPPASASHSFPGQVILLPSRLKDHQRSKQTVRSKLVTN